MKCTWATGGFLCWTKPFSWYHLIPNTSLMGAQRPLFPHPPKRFPAWEPWDGANSRGLGATNSAGAKLSKGKKWVQLPRSQMRIYLWRHIFTNCHFQTHFSYQNNPPTFPEDSDFCSCGSPQEGAQVFQLFGKKLNYSAKHLPGGLALVLKQCKNPLKPSCKCSQAVLQTFLSIIFPALTPYSSHQCYK